MLNIFMLPILVFLQLKDTEVDRIIIYQGKEYNTTISVDDKFIGLYKGKKMGFFSLKKEGVGVYKYDRFGFSSDSCTPMAITFEWGFLLNVKNEIIRKERAYGYSYPILLKSTSKTTFQGCRKPVMMDFILVKEEVMSISSSDDWEK